MPNKQANGRPVDGKLLFMQEFLKHPFQIGSIIPSSRHLEQRIVAAGKVSSARLVVELGAGTGGVTRALLRALPPQAQLLSIEINPHFHELVQTIEDDRLIAHLGSATELGEIITRYKLDRPDVVISGIPFSTMSRSMGTRIINAISSQLRPTGRFIAYQVSNRVATLCQPLLGPGETTIEFLNIPPMRIFQWQKPQA